MISQNGIVNELQTLPRTFHVLKYKKWAFQNEKDFFKKSKQAEVMPVLSL